jgi:hypothetical protein
MSAFAFQFFAVYVQCQLIFCSHFLFMVTACFGPIVVADHHTTNFGPNKTFKIVQDSHRPQTNKPTNP